MGHAAMRDSSLGSGRPAGSEEGFRLDRTLNQARKDGLDPVDIEALTGRLRAVSLVYLVFLGAVRRCRLSTVRQTLKKDLVRIVKNKH